MAPLVLILWAISWVVRGLSCFFLGLSWLILGPWALELKEFAGALDFCAFSVFGAQNGAQSLHLFNLRSGSHFSNATPQIVLKTGPEKRVL